MAKELRLFIAVDMSNEIKRELNNSLKVLKENTVSGRFSYAKDNQLTATISDHSYKVLPNLPKRKTPIEY